MEPSTRFKVPISYLSAATITVAAIFLTIFVLNHGSVEASAGPLFLFALIFFGPVSLFILVLNSGSPITVEAVVLLTATPTLLLAAFFWRSRYSAIFGRVGWFFWILCSLMVIGPFF